MKCWVGSSLVGLCRPPLARLFGRLWSSLLFEPVAVLNTRRCPSKSSISPWDWKRASPCANTAVVTWKRAGFIWLETNFSQISR